MSKSVSTSQDPATLTLVIVNKKKDDHKLAHVSELLPDLVTSGLAATKFMLSSSVTQQKITDSLKNPRSSLKTALHSLKESKGTAPIFFKNSKKWIAKESNFEQADVNPESYTKSILSRKYFMKNADSQVGENRSIGRSMMRSNFNNLFIKDNKISSLRRKAGRLV